MGSDRLITWNPAVWSPHDHGDAEFHDPRELDAQRLTQLDAIGGVEDAEGDGSVIGEGGERGQQEATVREHEPAGVVEAGGVDVRPTVDVLAVPHATGGLVIDDGARACIIGRAWSALRVLGNEGVVDEREAALGEVVVCELVELRAALGGDTLRAYRLVGIRSPRMPTTGGEDTSSRAVRDRRRGRRPF